MKWWLPILLMALITPWISTWDLALSHLFYHDGHFTSNGILDFFFNYGPLVSDLAIGISILALFKQKWRKPALIFLLTIAIGAGGIIHVALKDHWGRPRPKQTIEFGGTQPFRPYYQPNFFHQPMPSKSFPSGHSSVGFCFFALYFIGKRLNNKIFAYSGFALALALGIALSITRIAQGGHFLSDTLIAALIMWLTASCVDSLLYRKENAKIVPINY